MALKIFARRAVDISGSRSGIESLGTVQVFDFCEKVLTALEELSRIGMLGQIDLHSGRGARLFLLHSSLQFPMYHRDRGRGQRNFGFTGGIMYRPIYGVLYLLPRSRAVPERDYGRSSVDRTDACKTFS
jgi:hypothetical protein